MKTELRKTEQQIQNASFKHFPFHRVCIIESQIKCSKVIPKWNSLFIIFLQYYFWDREAFVLNFFSFGYCWDYFVLYKKQVFFSTFFLPFTMKAN